MLSEEEIKTLVGQLADHTALAEVDAAHATLALTLRMALSDAGVDIEEDTAAATWTIVQGGKAILVFDTNEWTWRKVRKLSDE